MSEGEEGYLPSEEESRRLTDEGVDASYRHADEEWREEAEAAIRYLIRYDGKVSSNDCWELGLPFPPNRRALGGVFRKLRKEGLIVPSGEKVRSRWGHGQFVTVWKRPEENQ